MKVDILDFRKKLGIAYAFYKEYKQWKAIKTRISTCNNGRKKLVIVPCDPWTVGGSRGDEAMIMGVIYKYRQKYPDISINIICADEKGIDYIKHFPINGIEPINSWNGRYPLERIYKSIVNTNPSDVVILGADCMDGFYSPLLSLSLLALHDLCKNTHGVRSHLLGFSFNPNPNWLMVRAFRVISCTTDICIRDVVSLMRFQQTVGKPAHLVADAAFMLQPQNDFPLYEELKQWIITQRNACRNVIGLNFHPMLRTYNGADDVKSDAVKLAMNTERILRNNRNVCFVFIPHDDRSRLTDNLMLSSMFEYLNSQPDGLIKRVFYTPLVPRADQLKAICGLLDGLISSRMHLAIAALGMGVPVMAATYQGKFEGLFKHFELDEIYLLKPHTLLSDRMIEVFNYFLNTLPLQRAQIEVKLPQVLELSNNNLKDD